MFNSSLFGWLFGFGYVGSDEVLAYGYALLTLEFTHLSGGDEEISER